MALGRKKRRQESLWIATRELPRTGGHVFYERVNRVLEEKGFDRFVEDACQKFYAPVMGRPGVVPGAYFRMQLVGYFEGLDSERGIAWRWGLDFRNAPNRADQDLIVRVDPVRIDDVLVRFPKLRPEVGVREVLFGNLPERIGVADDMHDKLFRSSGILIRRQASVGAFCHVRRRAGPRAAPASAGRAARRPQGSPQGRES